MFLTLEITEVVLFIANFAKSSTLLKIGGIVGVLTAICAWYTSAAGVINGMVGGEVLPVGRPMRSDLTAPRADTPLVRQR